MDAQVKDTVSEEWRRPAVADVFSVARELPVGWNLDATVDPGKIMAGVGGNFDGTADMCLHAIKFMGPRGRMGLARELGPVGRGPFAIAFRLATCFHPVKAMLDGVYSGRPPGFRVLVRDASGAEQVCVEVADGDGELLLNGQRTGSALPMLTWCSFCLVFDPIRQQATLYVEDCAVCHGAPPLPRLSECTAPLRGPKTRPAEIAFMLPDGEEGYAALWLDAFAVYEGGEPVMPAVAAVRRPAGEPLPPSKNRLSPLPAGSIRATGAIGARLDLAVRKNMMALDIDGDFLGPYGTAGNRGVEDREALEQGIFVGAGSLLDALARMAFYTGDQAVQEAAARLVERLSGLQGPNGYIGLYPETPERCPLFTEFCLHDAVYLVLGLAADYRLHGRAASLATARKLAAYIVANWARRPSAPVFTPLGINEAFMELYRAAPDPELLQFLKQERCGKQWTIQNASLLDWDQAVWTGGHGDRNKTQGGEAAERHAIVHVYRLFERCMAQLALCELQPDDRLTVMPRRIAARLLDRERTGLLITGAAGNGEGWEDTQRCAGQIGETCVTVYGIWLMDALLRHTGDLRYGDVMERMIYNALFGAQEPAGRRLRYFCPPSGKREYYRRDTYCCPNNFRRGIVRLPEHIYYTNPAGIVVNLFEDSVADLAAGQGMSVRLRQETGYPADDRTVLHFECVTGAAEFEVALRIPAWCREPVVTVNGESAESVVRRRWATGDRIELRLPMPWRFVRGRRRQDGRAAVMRGPVVYGLSRELNGLPDDMVLRDITLDPGSVASGGRDDRGVLDKPLCRIKAWSPGRAPRAAPDLDLLLHEFPEPTGEEVYFKLPDLAVAADDELLR